MDKNLTNFEDLIKKDKYQVFVCACPAYFPFNLAKHPWFVLNKKGLISRWEVRHYKNEMNKNSKYLYFNVQPPFQGINLSFFIKKYFWKTELLGLIEGEENSITQKIIEFIESSKENYPYCNQYSFFGPNSNTYIQWVLDNFPEFPVKLSWRFFGKNFKIKKI